MDPHEKYMYRCLELARRGAGYVAPNPMVGAVLVYKDRIIGEGWHKLYGGAHAEVHCIEQAIHNGFREQLPLSTLYVSLEPCAHYGKTPPCTDLITSHKIPAVIIGCQDPFETVNGKGIQKLRDAGINVTVSILGKLCRELNKRFFTFHEKQRPYVILKWAQTKQGIIGLKDSRLLVSNQFSNRLVHKWRAEEAAILVGTQTAAQDNPSLTTRDWPGLSPLRLVIDMDLKLPAHLKLFSTGGPVVVFNGIRHELEETFSSPTNPFSGINYYLLNPSEEIASQILSALHKMNIQSVIIEGGAKLIQTFINAGAWDEARVISSPDHQTLTGDPVLAPELDRASKRQEILVGSDKLEYFERSA